MILRPSLFWVYQKIREDTYLILTKIDLSMKFLEVILPFEYHPSIHPPAHESQLFAPKENFAE